MSALYQDMHTASDCKKSCQSAGGKIKYKMVISPVAAFSVRNGDKSRQPAINDAKTMQRA
jgi:hypothetical protein